MLDDLTPHYTRSKLSSARWVVWLCLLFVIGFFSWAHFAEVDQISRAQGVVIPSSRLQVVQAQEQAVVEQLHTGLGQKVNQGDVLIEFNNERAQAAVSESLAALEVLTALRERLSAEIEGRAPDFSMLPITDQKITESQRQLYDLRVRSFSQEIKGRERLLNLVAAELAANKPLLESGDVGLAEVMRLERAVAQADVELVAIKNKYYQSLQEQYVEVDAELASEREVLKQREVSLSAMTVKAPVSGVVKQIGFSTLGAVVKATDTLVEIVPEGDVLVVEARISPRDIAFVTIGQPASMSFDTYDASIYGSAAGQVIFVSPDSVILERSGQSEVFFPARVQVSTEAMFERGDVDLSIRAGMTGSVEVKTGRNTVLHYLFKPLVKTFSESLGER